MSVSARITSTCSASIQRSVGNTLYTGQPSVSYSATLTTDDISQCLQKSVTIDTSGTTYDVSSSTDDFGQSINMAYVKELIVVHNGDSGTITVGGGTNPVIAACPAISAGGCLHLTSTYTVSGSAKNIKVIASTGSISVDIIILGS